MSMIRNLYNNSALQGGFATTPYTQNPEYDKIGKSIWDQMQFTPRQLKAMQDFNARYGTVMDDWQTALGALYILDSWALKAKRLRSQLSFDKFIQSRGKPPKFSAAQRSDMDREYKMLINGLVKIRDTLHNMRVNKLPFYKMYLKIRKYTRKARGLSSEEREYLYDENAPYTRHTALTWLSYPPYKAQYDALVKRITRNQKNAAYPNMTNAQVAEQNKQLEQQLENSIFNQMSQPSMDAPELAATESTTEKRKKAKERKEKGYQSVTQTTGKTKKPGRKKMPKIPVVEEALPPLPDVPNLFSETPNVQNVTPEQLAAINQMPASGDIPAMPAALGAIAEDQAAAQALQDAEDEVDELLDKDDDDEY